MITFAEEERFIRLKHAPHIHPSSAIKVCLREAGLQPEKINVTAIGFGRPTMQHVIEANAGRYVNGTLSNDECFLSPVFLGKRELIYDSVRDDDLAQ